MNSAMASGVSFTGGLSINISGLPTGYYQLEVRTTSGVVSSQQYTQQSSFTVNGYCVVAKRE